MDRTRAVEQDGGPNQVKIYLAGPLTGDVELREKLREKLRAEGHEAIEPARTPVGRSEIGELLRWVCQEAEAVYLMPLWRTDTTARAARAAMVAVGGRVLGVL